MFKEDSGCKHSQLAEAASDTGAAFCFPIDRRGGNGIPCGHHYAARLTAFKPGGYPFNNVHIIQAEVPADYILAMYDAAFEFGKY